MSINVHLSYELKIANMIKFHAFLIYLAIPYMGVRVSGLKLVISPTYKFKP